jgi:hypothetical protein
MQHVTDEESTPGTFESDKNYASPVSTSAKMYLNVITKFTAFSRNVLKNRKEHTKPERNFVLRVSQLLEI